MNLKLGARRILRPLGWELRQYDPNLSLDNFLWMLFARLQINCVLDVGARHGEYATMLRNIDYRGHIISFEPVSENYQVLEGRQQNDPLWNIHQYALGSKSEASQINISAGTSLSSFLPSSEYGMSHMSGIEVKGTEPVQVRRLDEVLDAVTAHIEKPRIYLKMDTQGWDMEVLRGAKGCLDKILALQSEMSLQPLYEGAVELTTALHEFQAAGFAVSAFFNGWRDDSCSLAEIDCVMVRHG